MPSSISINLSFVTVNNWNEEQRGNHEALTCLKTSDNLKPHPHIIQFVDISSSICINLSFFTINYWNEEQKGNHKALI